MYLVQTYCTVHWSTTDWIQSKPLTDAEKKPSWGFISSVQYELSRASTVMCRQMCQRQCRNLLMPTMKNNNNNNNISLVYEMQMKCLGNTCVDLLSPSGLCGLTAMWAKQHKGNATVPCIALRALAARAVTRATSEQTALEAVSSLIITNHIEWKIHPKILLIKMNAHQRLLNYFFFLLKSDFRVNTLDACLCRTAYQKPHQDLHSTFLYTKRGKAWANEFFHHIWKIFFRNK